MTDNKLIICVKKCSFVGLRYTRLWFIYGFFVYAISMLDHVTLNFSVISELWIGKNVEGDYRVQFKDIVPSFA